ncbi:MAG: hypothetical protein J5685_08415 [Clostridiales bacterium]|nr:hypothetical protein [Clostridiales bacterium]
MNFFVEGLQGSGKSTLVGRLAGMYPDHTAVREGEYSPVELAWCAYVSTSKYNEIIEKYKDIRTQLMEKSYTEGDRTVICYTKIKTDIPGFYSDLEQYEIYNGRMPLETLKKTVLDRFAKWDSDNMIFECSLFQNIVEDMMLFHCMSDQEITGFYKELAGILKGKDYRIMYLEADDISSNMDIIRKERSDGQGNELWFPLMCGYFDSSPYAKSRGISGETELLRHLAHRQELELRICREVFPDRFSILRSKGYWERDLMIL